MRAYQSFWIDFSLYTCAEADRAELCEHHHTH